LFSGLVGGGLRGRCSAPQPPPRPLENIGGYALLDIPAVVGIVSILKKAKKLLDKLLRNLSFSLTDENKKERKTTKERKIIYKRKKG